MLQLHPDILQVAAADEVSALAALEGAANPNGLCAEWVARYWQDLGPSRDQAEKPEHKPEKPVAPDASHSLPAVFHDAGGLVPLFSMQCRSHPRKSTRALPGGCPHEHDALVDATLRLACGKKNKIERKKSKDIKETVAQTANVKLPCSD